MAKRRKGRKQEALLVRSAELVGWALGGLEREIAQTRERLNALTAQASQLRGRLAKAGRGQARAAANAPVVRRARRMSAEARRAASERMRKYWAERRKNKK